MFEKYSIEGFQAQPISFLTDAFRFLEHNAEIVTVLLSTNGDITFVDRMKEFVREKCLNSWMQVYSYSNPLPYEYFYTFTINGIIGLFQTWLDRGRKESPEEMAQIAERIISHGIQILD